MARSVDYKREAIVYFEGDRADKIYVVQSGLVKLTSRDMETNEQIIDTINPGEFFGVKSAMGKYPREDAAHISRDSRIMIFTLPEFEEFCMSNTRIVMKMLKVFSNQLREVNHKLASMLKQKEADHDDGLYNVGEVFLKQNRYERAYYVLKKYIDEFANGKNIESAKKNLAVLQKRGIKDVTKTMLEVNSVIYKDGEIIFAEHERGDKFYLIQAGSVELIKTFGNISKTLDILKFGETFGEMALLEDSPRSATAIALGETKLNVFDRNSFEQLVLTNPKLAFRLLKMFVRRIYDAKRRFLILVLEEPNTRVADVFLMLDEDGESGKQPDNAQREFTASIDNIARWAGLSVEMAKDSIAYFSRIGYLQVLKEKMIVKDINNFIRLVNNARGKHKH